MNIDLDILHLALSREISETLDLLQREIDEDNVMTKARENNYRLLQLILEQPTLSPRDYDSMLFKNYGIDRSHDVHVQLRTSNLYSSEKRLRFSTMMKEISQSTYRLIIGKSSDSFKDFDDVASKVRSSIFFERKVEGKVFLIALTSLSAWREFEQSPYLRSSLEIVEGIAKKGSYKLCREVARRLLDVIGAEYGIERRKTSTERVHDILEDVAITRDVEDMRATLLIVQRESEHLRTQFEEEVRNRNQEFIRDFFSRMNSVRHSELLDSIAQTDFMIQELRKRGWSIEPELQAIPLIIQVFVKFLSSEGVVPIESVGEIKELNETDLSNYEFVGTRNPKPSNKVNVMIKTPGWRFGSTTISRPRVEELSN